MKKTTAYKPSSTYEEVMELFRELAKEQKENYRQWQEYQRTEAEAKKEAERKEAEAKKEAERKEAEAKKEAEREEAEAKKEAEKRNKEWDKKMRELQELFTGQWGKLVEALMAPGCLKLFQERGIKITQGYPNLWVEKFGKHMEIDLMLVNNTELVVIEIKTTARANHVDKLLGQLAEFKKYFPQYANYTVYGAIAAIRYEQQSDTYAAKQGLFVIKSDGERLVKLANNTKFKPKSH